MVGFEKVGKRRVPFAGQCKDIYKMCNTTLLRILPVSGKLGFISLARFLTGSTINFTTYNQIEKTVK
jgi:hypothetical protein